MVCGGTVAGGKPARKPARKPAKKPAKKPVRKPARKPVRKHTKKPAGKSIAKKTMADYKAMAKRMKIPLSKDGKPRTRSQLARAISYRKGSKKK